MASERLSPLLFEYKSAESIPLPTPFPIHENIANCHHLPAIESSLLEVPLQQALLPIARLREDATPDFDVLTYLEGAEYSQLRIRRQMKENLIPDLNEEQMTFAGQLFIENLSSDIRAATHRTYSLIESPNQDELSFQIARSLPIEWIKLAFLKADTKRIDYMKVNEPYLIRGAEDDIKTIPKKKISSYYSGAYDTYFMYKAYFDSLNQEKVA